MQDYCEHVVMHMFEDARDFVFAIMPIIMRI